MFDNRLDLERIHSPKVQHGAGWATKTLENSSESVEKRTEAMFIVGENVSFKENKLMQSLLSDDQDEIRLLAFSLLEQQERKIMNSISACKKAIADEKGKDDPNKLALNYKNIAILYWELIYRNLLEKDLRTMILKEAYHYANLAVQHLPKDAILWVLIGKIYLYEKKYDEAERAFKQAIHDNALDTLVYPYLAEIMFSQHKYVEIKKLLQPLTELKEIPRLSEVVSFWSE